MAIKTDQELKDEIATGRLTSSLMTDIVDSKVSQDTSGNVSISGGLTIESLKSGVSQIDAGASANELWIDTADNSIKIGV